MINRHSKNGGGRILAWNPKSFHKSFIATRHIKADISRGVYARKGKSKKNVRKKVRNKVEAESFGGSSQPLYWQYAEKQIISLSVNARTKRQNCKIKFHPYSPFDPAIRAVQTRGGTRAVAYADSYTEASNEEAIAMQSGSSSGVYVGYSWLRQPFKITFPPQFA